MKAIWLACCACGDYGLLQREVEGRDAGAQVLRVGDLDGLISMARAFPSRRGAAIIAASLFDIEDVRKTVARLTAEGRVSRVVVLIEALDPSDIEGLFRAGATEVIAAHSICGNGRAGEGAVDSDRRMTIEPDAFVDREPGAPRATRGPRVDDYGKAEAEHGRRPRNPLVYDDAGGPAQHAGDSPAVDMGYVHGVNLADEYINKVTRFGHWKDSGVRLDGPGAASLANIFLTFWKAKYPDEDLDAGCDLPAAVPVETDCLVQPFADTPVDREAVAKNVYLELINQAQKRLYICTPYLILDNDLLSCLRLAAKRGVDVRIYTPGVPDKPTIYQLTRSYFPHLLQAGVKIYSYTPGFLHAKTWLVDDRIAAVGTVNLDYRSLYLHFENSVLLYGGAVLDDVQRDLAEIEKESAAVTLADCRTGFFGTLYSAVLRLVAPLC